jgi:hypothetical protein
MKETNNKVHATIKEIRELHLNGVENTRTLNKVSGEKREGEKQ